MPVTIGPRPAVREGVVRERRKLSWFGGGHVPLHAQLVRCPARWRLRGASCDNAVPLNRLRTGMTREWDDVLGGTGAELTTNVEQVSVTALWRRTSSGLRPLVCGYSIKRKAIGSAWWVCPSDLRNAPSDCFGELTKSRGSTLAL